MYIKLDLEKISSRPCIAEALIRFNAERLDLVQVDRIIKSRLDNLAFVRENRI